MGSLKIVKNIAKKHRLPFYLPHRSRKRIPSRARAPNMVKFGVSFSRGVKNGGCLFPKMVLFEGPKPSKSMSRPSKSSKLSATSGTQTLLRETNPRVWGGQSAPRITFFLSKCQNRLRMSGKKWRLAILFLQPEPSISSILSVFGYHCCADFCLVP